MRPSSSATPAPKPSASWSTSSPARRPRTLRPADRPRQTRPRPTGVRQCYRLHPQNPRRHRPGPPPDLPPSRVIKGTRIAMPQPSPQLPASRSPGRRPRLQRIPRQTPDHRRHACRHGRLVRLRRLHRLAARESAHRRTEIRDEAARKPTTNPRSTSLTPRSALSSSNSDTDLLVQKALAACLPPAGLFVLGWSLYYSRGAYRLQNHISPSPATPRSPSTPSARSIARLGPQGHRLDQLRNWSTAPRQRLPGRLHLPAPTHRRHL